MPRGLDIMSGLGRPLISTTFEVIISVPLALQALMDKKELNYRVLATSLPGIEVETVDVPGGDTVASPIKYPSGRVKYSNAWTCTFLEGNLAQVDKLMNNWCLLNGDPDTGVAVNSVAVKSTISIQHYDNNEVVTSRQLIGAFPTKTPDTKVSIKDAASRIEREVTFSYDRWR